MNERATLKSSTAVILWTDVFISFSICTCVLDSFSMGLQSERAQKSNKENTVALRVKSIKGSASPALDPMIKFIKMINVYT